mmetsp:Transcript_38241/g.43101  ORF Transcript_38241/g.43101 Transcript_38241/m.43101 type:complete len:270 (+) Transcript_38241:83-892(+)
MFSFLSRNDTVQYLIAFSLLLLTDVQEVDASCTSSSEPCELHSGNCFNPVLLSLNGDVSAAIDALEYGKYCGRFNRCRPKKIASDLCQFDEVTTCKRKKSTKFNSKKEKNKKGKKEKYSKDEDEEEEAPCPAVACDEVDSACEMHDICLDTIIIEDALCGSLPIPIPRRCACEVELVFNLAVTIQNSDGKPTGLCDADFYERQISESFPVTPIDILGNEATLIAAGSCCQVLECSNDGYKGDDPIPFEVAVGFCTTLVDAFTAQGINNC